MRKLSGWMRIVGLLFMLVAWLAGGCASSAYKGAVSLWSRGHIPAYLRYVANDPSLEPHDRILEYHMIADLECVGDEDSDQLESAACQCSRATDPGGREEACDSWAKATMSRSAR
jgi:hypothetical protein